VGSAAFNLLVITSVCVVAPSPETRTIEQTSVYACTAIFSVWAYVWLLLMIDFISPEIIELWEAVVTLLHFPVLVAIAYGFDRKWNFSSGEQPPPTQGNTLAYRMNAVRMITGAPRKQIHRGKAGKKQMELDDTPPEENEHGLSSDPYVKLTYNGSKDKTGYKKKNLNPKWKEVFGFTWEPTAAKELLLEVYDHDDLSSDDFMGMVVISLEGVTEVASDAWFPLQDKKGTPGAYGDVHVQYYVSEKTGELIIKVIEGRNLLALEKSNATVDAVASALGAQQRAIREWFGRQSQLIKEMRMGYKAQFETAMRVAGETDDDGNELPPSSVDLLMHFLTIFWKVLFACIPPAEFFGGWLAFGVALIFIGGVTMVVGELAGLFGCAVGLETATTAITFVALGTSLPDMFASKVAAINEETADNAVGNVTGSNGVNVFLGIGLPWTIAAFYKEVIKGEKFVARSNGFGLSVGLFLAGALPFLAVLTLRRMRYGGELGGPKVSANITAAFACTLWFVYIIGSAMVHYDHLESYAISSDADPLPPPPGPWYAGMYPAASEDNKYYMPFS